MKNAIINFVLFVHACALNSPSLSNSSDQTDERTERAAQEPRDSNVVIVKCIVLLLIVLLFVRLTIRVGSYRNAVAVHVRATCTWHNCGFAEKE